jgi:hypothetical protein
MVYCKKKPEALSWLFEEKTPQFMTNPIKINAKGLPQVPPVRLH